MAEIQSMTVPYSCDLRCPICNEDIEVNVEVQLKAEGAQTAGRNGFGRTVSMQVYIEKRPVKVIISHECLYTQED